MDKQWLKQFRNECLKTGEPIIKDKRLKCSQCDAGIRVGYQIRTTKDGCFYSTKCINYHLTDHILTGGEIFMIENFNGPGKHHVSVWDHQNRAWLREE